MSVLVIAEAGVNHNGNFTTACRLVDAAKDSGADCIKFQTFKAEKLVSRSAKKADYQRNTTGNGTQAEMLKKLELSFPDFMALKEYCDHVGISFLSTPFDLESIVFLNSLGMPFWKIPSGEVTDLPYLEAIARTGKPVIMSTGMCDLDEVAAAIRILRENGSGRIRLLHCNTEYPTPYEDVNLRAMQTMRDAFGLEVGYSDHTRGFEVPIAAVALGATVVEKHFTLDRSMDGPDHRASLEPDELTAMISAVRNIEKALGTGDKMPSASEHANIAAARRSIVARRRIRKGETFTEDNLTVKRPGTGISPMCWYDLIGERAKRDYEEDELIER